MISDLVRVSRLVLLEHRLWNSTDRRRLSREGRGSRRTVTFMLTCLTPGGLVNWAGFKPELPGVQSPPEGREV